MAEPAFASRNLAGHETALRTWPGDADRPALAISCMLGSAGLWTGVADQLQGRVALTGFDLPGHGRSADWQPTPDGPDYATLSTRIAAELIDRPIDLIGHSFGATIALRIAVAAPEAIRTLTLIEPVLFAAVRDTPGNAENARWAEALGALFKAGDIRGATRMFTTTWGTDFDALPVPAQEAMIRRMPLVQYSNKSLYEDTGRILRKDGLEAIDAPVMLIAGAESPAVIHDIADALAARLPDVGRATVPGAAHMLPATHPVQVAGLIGANLDRA
ncbi:alpha/beta fold hydrolase [Paracoccus pacificus]|uniref:Alpha/beta fold hydrolase n=1 Tax=Paracoccus pacificus TaxID=1463598 RepID=A0ABW4R9G8_9RHOB